MIGIRRTLALFFFLLPLAANAQLPPSKERGFKPELAYQFGNFDNVTLFNGNLTAAIPLGPAYPVGGGLSYSFVLRYSGGLWKNFDDCRYVQNPGGDDSGCFHITMPVLDNGGFGWRLSFGDLRGPGTSIIDAGTAPSMWAYISPDGSEHLFYKTLHNGETVTTGVRYTRDGSYLRMKEYPDHIVVEHPNGERHWFEENDERPDDWRLRYIYTAFSTLSPSTGAPTSNLISFEYLPSGTSGVDDTWKITDSHGREHHVEFIASPFPGAESDLVETIDIEAFRNGGSDREGTTYTLGYQTLSLTKPGQGWMHAALLSSVTLPSGEAWSFTYNTPPLTAPADSDERRQSALMASATLPTGGVIEWEWQNYIYGETMPIAVGVAVRTVKADGAEIEYTTYDAAMGSTTVTRHVKAGGQWQPHVKTIQKHGSANGVEFGLPYDPASAADSSGRRISSQTQSCNPACTTVREQWVKYEWDHDNACNIDYPCQQNRNRRPKSERTVFTDDGDLETTVSRDQFDGLGHYRLTTSGGTIPGNDRTSFIKYNEAAGTYNASDGSGFTMLSSTAPWILETYTSGYQDEDGETAHFVACFDSATGFLLRRRTLTGILVNSKDLLTVFTPHTSGYVEKDEYFGGDKHSIPAGDTCTASPGHNDSTVSIKHTYEHGALKTSRYLNANETPVSFFSVNNSVIDQGTGLVRESTDAGQIVTKFEYDRSARLTKVDAPAGLLDTTYSYGIASGATRAKVSVNTGSGSTRIASEVELDPVGRVWRERKLMPGGQWSVRETLYDALGRRSSVSEPGFGNPSAKITKFEEYDPIGRPGKVTAPDGAVTTFAYFGNRRTERTQKVATSETSETNGTVAEEYDRAGRLVSVTENSGGSPSVTTTYQYDAGNHLRQVTIGSSPAQHRFFHYNDFRGLLTSEQHPESGTTTYLYDSRGKVVQRTTPLTTLKYQYDRAERLTSVTQNDVTLKAFAYDTATGAGLGRVASSVRHNRDTVLGSDVTITESYSYSTLGQLSEKATSASTGESFTDKYAYDAFGQLEKIDYPSCAGCGNMPPAGWKVQNVYANGLLSQIVGYTSAATPVAYHANGMLSDLRHLSSNGAIGPIYQQTLDNEMPRPGSITVTNYCNDFTIQGQPQDVTVPPGSPAGIAVSAPGATSYEWFQGSSTTALPGEDGPALDVQVSQTTTFRVRVGNGVCTIDSRTATVTVAVSSGTSYYTVNPCRIIDTRLPDGPGGGPPVGDLGERVVQASGICSIPPGAMAIAINVTAITPPGTGFMTLYPSDGGWPGTSTINYRTAKNRANNAIVRISAAGQFTVFNFNDSAGATHFVVDVNGYFQETSSGFAQRIVSPSSESVSRPEIVRAASSPATWTTGTYAYDGSGNIKSITRSDFTEKFVYDPFGRLTKGSVSPGRSEEYTYDQFGNRLTRKTDGGSAFTYGVDSATNRVSVAGHNLTANYDNAGRLTGVPSLGSSFTYDAFDSVADSTVDGQRRAHLYTAADERIASVTVVNNVPSAWTWTIRDPSAKVLRRFIKPHGGMLTWSEDYVYRGAAMLAADVDAPEKRRVFHPDHLGTPRLITGNGGAQIGMHSYYPFGTEVTPAQEGEQKKYTGHERDASNLDYMHARSSAPMWGRFLSVDPVLGIASKPQSWNKYGYVQNQPVNFHDPTGAYRTDFHYDLTRIIAVAAGYSVADATNIAAMTELPDHDSRNPMNAVNYGARAAYHFPSRARLQAMYVDASASGGSFEIGTYLHALQDSFSHRGHGPLIGHIGPLLSGVVLDAGNALFGGPTGATGSGFVESYDVDTTSARPGLAMEAARATYDALVKFNGGNATVPFNAVSGAILGYLSADQYSVLRTFYENRLKNRLGIP